MISEFQNLESPGIPNPEELVQGLPRFPAEQDRRIVRFCESELYHDGLEVFDERSERIEADGEDEEGEGKRKRNQIEADGTEYQSYRKVFTKP